MNHPYCENCGIQDKESDKAYLQRTYLYLFPEVIASTQPATVSATPQGFYCQQCKDFPGKSHSYHWRTGVTIYKQEEQGEEI